MNSLSRLFHLKWIKKSPESYVCMACKWKIFIMTTHSLMTDGASGACHGHKAIVVCTYSHGVKYGTHVEQKWNWIRSLQINLSPHGQNGRRFEDDIFKAISLNEKARSTTLNLINQRSGAYDTVDIVPKQQRHFTAARGAVFHFG